MSFLDFLRAQPVFTLFLVLGAGQLIGRLRIGVVTLVLPRQCLFAWSVALRFIRRELP